MRRIGLLMVSLALGGACGGNDAADGGNDPGLCTGFTACGGDPTGTWTVTGFCDNDVGGQEFEECPAATVDLDFTQTGTVTLNSDSSYQFSINTDGVGTLTIPGSCLTGITECSIFDDDELLCTGDPASACTCQSEINEVDMDTGTWAVSGTTITLTDQSEQSDDLEFCVDGNTLTVRDAEDDVVIRMTR